MRYNIIFLDFDGVIVTQKSRFNEFDKGCIALLKQIIEETDAHIVISSSWRYQTSLEQFRELFKPHGINNKRIIGLTPKLKSRTRGQEISAWLKEVKDKIEVKAYVILDDDSDMTKHMDNFVKTDTYKGMSNDNVLKAIDILKGQKNELPSIAERIWEQFVRKDLVKGVVPKNFLGSIAQHKKLFMEAAEEIEQDQEADKQRKVAITSFDGYYDFLSNFYEDEMEVDSIKYPTLEHAFQSLKTDDPDEREKVRKSATPGKAKGEGKLVTLTAGWNTKRIDVMRKLLKIKFSKHLKGSLFRTAPNNLVEGNCWHDNFWGACNCPWCRGKKKENNLGKLLMEVREELMNKETE